MPRLVRKVRLALTAAEEAAHRPANTYAGFPRWVEGAAWVEIAVHVAAEPDERTGFVADIRELDELTRSASARACAQAEGAPSHAAALLAVAHSLAEALGGRFLLAAMRPSPTLLLALERDDMTHALICQRFEFAAAHRLHSPALSEEENRAVFGLCNNPSGHGHNYWLEPVVRTPLRDGTPALSLAQLEQATLQTIVQRFDHKHLNVDCEEFQQRNPTVENIARVCFELLAPAIEEASQGAARLECVRLWETEKTCCVYPAMAGAAWAALTP